MERSLSGEGFTRSDNPETADFHLINSCAFIEDAKMETIRTVLGAAKIKKKHKNQKLVLVGCFSERYAENVRTDLPEVDFSFGTGRYHEAGALIGSKFGPASKSQSVTESRSDTEKLSPLFSIVKGASFAPVKISDGCDRGCSFCAIPIFRGKFRDIPLATIVQECRDLASSGVREVCLVSQDSNSYGGNPGAFLDLLEALHDVPDLHWIRMLYMYPDGKTEAILNGLANRSLPKLVPYLESPIQHASTRMLRAMRRIGDRERFKAIFSLARSVMPGSEVRTSVLLGFPGETEADVDEVLEFLEESRPEKLALFSYSPEEGTPGATLPDQVPPEVTGERVNRVRNAFLLQHANRQRDLVGQTFRCMVDETQDQEIIARRAQDAPEADGVVYLPNSRLLSPGDLVNVQITGFAEFDLTGVIV